MALLKIVPQFRKEDKHVSQKLTLDGIPTQLEAYTNTITGLWHFDLADGAGNYYVQGIALVGGIDLLHPYRYISDMPPGKLFIADQSGLDVDPGLTSFIDGDASLYYLEAL